MIENLKGIDARIDEMVQPVAEAAMAVIFYEVQLFGKDVPLILMWLAAVGVFTTFYFGFINIRKFPLAVGLLTGKYVAKDESKNKGQISNWEALSTSLSGTVGLGNIAGVAIAISVGGPGAMVWMILMGFIGMSTKFAECALGVKYRDIAPNGEVSGGPMYYLKKGFARHNLVTLGKVMAVLFALGCIGGSLGGGNMYQANQSFSMLVQVTGGEETSFLVGKGWMYGVVLAFMVALVIMGGIKSIAHTCAKLFPAMMGLYMAAGLFVVLTNYSHVPEAFMAIIDGAFNPHAAGGGILGALLAGIQRAAFSNESGIGSAPIAHAAVKTSSHITQGLISMLNPFIDTVVICTMTALVITISGAYLNVDGMEGVALTVRAFESAVSWFPYVLTVCVLLFAYSTILAWFYLGEKAFTYLFGETQISVRSFQVVWLLCLVIGASSTLENIIGLTDALFFSMAITNIVAIYMMAPELKRDIKVYFDTFSERYIKKEEQ